MRNYEFTFPPDDVDGSFRTEVEDCAYLVGEAIWIWYQSFYNRAGPASLMFATGIEKLMKLALIKGGFKETRALNHSLSKIISKLKERNVLSDPTVFEDRVVQTFVKFLDQMSGADRYRNLDHVLDPSKFKAPAHVLAMKIKVELLVAGMTSEEATRTLLAALFNWLNQISEVLVADDDPLRVGNILSPYAYGTFDGFFNALERDVPPHRQVAFKGNK